MKNERTEAREHGSPEAREYGSAGAWKLGAEDQQPTANQFRTPSSQYLAPNTQYQKADNNDN